MDEDAPWSHSLSGGEQQRLAFSRLLIDPPDIVIMDEATSALDEVSEARMMELLRTDLASITVIGVSRRGGLDGYFEREIMLRRWHGLPHATVLTRNNARSAGDHTPKLASEVPARRR